MNAGRSFPAWLADKRRQYGPQFDDRALAPAFVPYFENGKRIKVQSGTGRPRFGTVGVTTGWRPAFLLMYRCTSYGSYDVLSRNDTILAVQDRPGGPYRPLVSPTTDTEQSVVA